MDPAKDPQTFWVVFAALAQAAAALATFLAVAVALAPIVRDWLLQPKLSVSCEVADQVRTIEVLNGAGACRVVRIRVTNELGQRTAEGCRGNLIGHRIIRDDGTEVDAGLVGARLMGWEGRKTTELHLHSGESQRLDLLIVAALLPGESDIPVSPSWDLRGVQGQHVLTVQVSALNADPKIVEVSLEWNGTLESTKVSGTRDLTPVSKWDLSTALTRLRQLSPVPVNRTEL